MSYRVRASWYRGSVRFVVALGSIALAACNLFDTSGIGSGPGIDTVGTGDTSTDDGPDASTGMRHETSSTPDSSAGESEPSTDTSATTDTGDDPSGLGPFTPGVPVFELNTLSHEFDPTLRGDQLEIFFASDRSGSYALWTSVRESIDDEWSPPIEVSTGSGEQTSPELSHDGLVLTYASNFGGLGSLDIWVAVRATVDEPWDVAVRVEELSTPETDVGAVMSGDLLELFLCSESAGNEDIFRSTRNSQDEPWNMASSVLELNTGGYECAPFLDASGRWLLFRSDSLGGRGGFDIWAAERRGDDEEFAQPRPVDDVNGPGDQYDPWLSPELDTLWFAAEPNGDADLFHAVRRE